MRMSFLPPLILMVASLGLSLGQASASSSSNDEISSLSLRYHPKANGMKPHEYCPHLGSDFPPEDGCYPGGGANPSGYPKCCSKQQRGIGNCPNNRRPKCENEMLGAPSYCADLRPDFDCYVNGWPQCCVKDGTMCPPSIPACDVGVPSSPPSQTPTLQPSLYPTLDSLPPGICILKPPYDSSLDPTCGSDSFCSIPNGVCKNNAVFVGTCEAKPQKHCSEEYQPICGCDGRTYGNKCHAEVTGVNIRKNGACKK